MKQKLIICLTVKDRQSALAVQAALYNYLDNKEQGNHHQLAHALDTGNAEIHDTSIIPASTSKRGTKDGH